MLLSSCTSNHNKIADEAFGRAVAQQQTIVNDLYMLATQGVTDRYCAAARAAATGEDPDAAAQAVKDALTEYDKITWLTREQQTLVFELLRVPRRYIWSQRGWFSILKGEWDESRRRMQSEEAALPGPLTPVPGAAGVVD
jgi:hypothetical protein